MKVQIRFVNAIKAEDGSLFDVVEFDVASTGYNAGAFVVIFADGKEYSYPWHNIARVRVIRE